MSRLPSDLIFYRRRGLFIIDLEAPLEVPRFLPQGGTWDVADVQWNPHPTRAEYIVSTSSQKLRVFTVLLFKLNFNIGRFTDSFGICSWSGRPLLNIYCTPITAPSRILTGIPPNVIPWSVLVSIHGYGHGICESLGNRYLVRSLRHA